MFKKSICLVLTFCLAFSLFSCVSKKEKEFEKTAKQYFSQFEQMQTATKSKNTIEYGEKGSYAVNMPKTGEDSFDEKLEAYCDGIVADFTAKSTSPEDMLLVSYESYGPEKDIYGIQIHTKTVMNEQTVESCESFNYGIEMTENLKKLVTIEARDTFPGIKKENSLRMLVTNSGIRAYFKTDEGEKETEVPFSKLRAFVPASLCKDEGGRYIDITKKMVAITFDDGPHNTYSNKILDTLEKHNSVATFFEVGNLVSQGADTIKRADALGCEIASHTWSHGNLQTLSKDGILSQIDKADEAFEKVIGRKPKLLRPPYGAVGKTLRENTDKYLIGWSVDTNDWKYRDKDKIVSVIKNEDSLDGDVILMHSLYESTAKATEEIVPWLISEGYQLVTVSELVKYKYEDVLEEGKYYAYNYFDYED